MTFTFYRGHFTYYHVVCFYLELKQSFGKVGLKTQVSALRRNSKRVSLEKTTLEEAVNDLD